MGRPTIVAPAIREDRLAADHKAEDLLRRLLDPVELADYERRGYIDLHGASGTHYRIRRGSVANIDVLDAEERVRHRLCVHPHGHLPVADVMAAQLLHLRANERDLLRIANVHPAIH